MDMTSEAKMQEKTTGFIKKADFCLKKFLHLKTVFYVGERASLENIDISYQKIEKRWKYCFWENEASDVEKEYNRGNGLEKKAEENTGVKATEPPKQKKNCMRRFEYLIMIR